MTREEANKLAEKKYLGIEGTSYTTMVIKPLREAYVSGLLDGYEKGVRDSAEAAEVVYLFGDKEIDKDSILQLIDQLNSK